MNGGGVVFQTSRGFMNDYFVVPFHCLHAFKVELYSTIYKLDLAEINWWDAIWLAVDSYYVVHIFPKRSLVVPWSLRNR